MIELPRGIKPVTGLLFAHADHGAVGAAADENLVLRLMPGPGFAVGLHGFSLLETANPGADGNGYRWELGSNTEITPVQDGLGNDVIYSAEQRVEGAPGQSVLWNPNRMMNAGPILVIRDVISRVNSLTGVSAFSAIIYYALYEVSDSDFLRIAGIQLASRGSASG